MDNDSTNEGNKMVHLITVIVRTNQLHDVGEECILMMNTNEQLRRSYKINCFPNAIDMYPDELFMWTTIVPTKATRWFTS